MSRVLFLDESIEGNVITVGGVHMNTGALGVALAAWRQLKSNTFGIDPSTELKYTMPSNHPTRAALDANGWTQKVRVPEMLDCIAGLDVVVLADTLIDGRAGPKPRDFYLDALKWCVRRFANDVDARDGPHWVVTDMPSAPPSMTGRSVSRRLRDLHKTIGTASFDVYERGFHEPERFGTSMAASYKDCGLGPTLLAAHARHSEHLQLADVVSGAVRDFCWSNVDGADPSGNLPPHGYPEANLGRLRWRFRRGPSGVCTFGFDLFPPDAVTAAIKLRLEGICPP
jgi:hypothetical protein